MAGKLLFADAHLHSNPAGGLGARIIGEKMVSLGGWFAALVALGPYHYGVEGFPSPESYRKGFSVFLSECRAMRETGLRVACFAGMHPAEVDRALGVLGDRALGVVEEVMELVEGLCREGVLDGVGEVGRPHYRAQPAAVALAEYVMLRGLEIARDHDCLVHLHLENQGAATVATVEKLVRLANVEPWRVFFHHSSQAVARAALERGFQATLPGKPPALRAVAQRAPELLQRGALLESDYIDDPRRPCVSACPWEVFEEEKRLLQEGLLDEETLHRVNVDNVVRAYRVEPP